jgi:hypothetical protein
MTEAPRRPRTATDGLEGRIPMQLGNFVFVL